MIPLGVVGYGSRICSVISSCLRAVELDLRVIAVVDHGTLSFDWYKNEMKHVRHHEPFTDTIIAGEGLSHFGGDAELAEDFIGPILGLLNTFISTQWSAHSIGALCTGIHGEIYAGESDTISHLFVYYPPVARGAGSDGARRTIVRKALS